MRLAAHDGLVGRDGRQGIAAELDVAPSTVVTWRKRAYANLAARGLTGGRMQLAAWVR